MIAAMGQIAQGICECVYFILIVSSGHAADCPGIHSHLNSENIVNFEGCSRVMGNIVLNEVSFQSDATVAGSIEPLTMEQLSVLSNIVEVDGYVQVENTNYEALTHLRFLRNLETIHGHETYEVFPNQQYSLVISGNNYLQTLNLASLRRIENGGIRIISNSQLCLVDTISVEDYLITSSLHRVGDYAQDCSDVMCHDQCEMSRGCWGTLADECVQCRSYNYQGTCVESCDESVSYTDNEIMSCVPRATVTAATTLTRIKQDMKTDPIPTSQYPNTTHRNRTKLSVSTRLQIKTTPTSETTLSDSLPQWMVGGIASMLSLAVLTVFIVMTVVGIKVAYTFQRRKKAKSVIGGGNISKLRDTKLIHVVNEGTESQRQVRLIRRQHVCSKVSSGETYVRDHDAASPEPEVLVMVESEETADQDRYSSMLYEYQKYIHRNVNHSPEYQCHVTPSNDTYNNNPPSPVYDSVDVGSFYDSTTHVTDQDCPTPGMDKTTQQNGVNTSVSGSSTIINTRYKSKNQDPGSAFQYPLTDGAVYSTRTTTSSSHTRPTYPTSLTHSQRTAYSSHRTSRAGQRTTHQMSGVSHHLSTTGGSTISSSRTATSTFSV